MINGLILMMFVDIITLFILLQSKSKCLCQNIQIKNKQNVLLISVFDLQKFLQEGLSELTFYGDLVNKFRKIVGKTDFSVQFKKIVTRYKKIVYNMIILHGC